jgi:hypothetical protein
VFAPRAKVQYVTEVKALPEQVDIGERVGTMKLVLNDRELASAPLLSAAAIDPPETSFLLEVIEAILGFGAAVGRAVGAE